MGGLIRLDKVGTALIIEIGATQEADDVPWDAALKNTLLEG
jgi:hypothetical protein